MRHKWRTFSLCLTINFIVMCILFFVDQKTQWLKSMVDGFHDNEKVKVTQGQSWPNHWDPRMIQFMKEMERVKVSQLQPGMKTSSENRTISTVDMSKYSYSDLIYFVPPVPKLSISDDLYNIAKNITDKYLTLDPERKYKEKILILTPIHNSAKSLPNYAKNINSLTYPKHLVSVCFGEDSSHDSTMNVAHELAKDLKDFGFRRTGVFHFDISSQVGGSWSEIHSIQVQFVRRKHLAQARNLLLKAGLKDEDYVLWIDSDIGSIPPDLIQQLLYANKDVVTPLCLFTSGGRKRVYDKNTWRETPASLANQERMSKSELAVEGYGPTSRLFLNDLRGEGRIVPIDGVGGCSLLIKASCHKKGLKFPEEIYKHHIETEGLAKIAKDMGFGVYGLPFVEVFHS